MSHKDKHPSKHAAKKAAILARNKKHTLINEQADFHEDSQRLERERDEAVRQAQVAESAVGSDGEVVWSARLQDVRNKLNGKKRMANDRWNRFAGTAGGGGRGR